MKPLSRTMSDALRYVHAHPGATRIDIAASGSSSSTLAALERRKLITSERRGEWRRYECTAAGAEIVAPSRASRQFSITTRDAHGNIKSVEVVV